MKLEIINGKSIRDVQKDFNDRYPFLKLEFYKVTAPSPSIKVRERLPHSTLLKSAGLKNRGSIDINDAMTVGELENNFLEQFGLIAQVSRNSGGIWLETTMTDNWSLQKQNDYGREIINHSKWDHKSNGQNID